MGRLSNSNGSTAHLPTYPVLQHLFQPKKDCQDPRRKVGLPTHFQSRQSPKMRGHWCRPPWCQGRPSTSIGSVLKETEDRQPRLWWFTLIWRRPCPHHPRLFDRGTEDCCQGPQGQATGPGCRQIDEFVGFEIKI